MIAVLLLVVACKKSEPPPTVAHDVHGAPRDAAVAMRDGAAPAIAPPGDALPADVELVQLTAATVRVSSRVANPDIRPAHLVDKNLSTAWNSVTGQLVGAWIELRPIAGAEIHEVRLTAGFTARGPKGEDWFTMNPRVRRVRVIADGAPQPDLYLDVDRRTLQAFPIVAQDSVRLEVAEVVSGTKPRWREVSISELEAWGSLPVRWTSPRPLPSIEVAVGEADEPAVFDPCIEIEKRAAIVRAESDRINATCDQLGCEDHTYPGACDPFAVSGLEELEPPWARAITWCEVNDEIYGPTACYVRFARGREIAVASAESPHATAKITARVEVAEVLAAAPGPELVVTFDGAEDDARYDDGVRVAVCRTDTFACSDARIVRGALAAQTWTFR